MEVILTFYFLENNISMKNITLYFLCLIVLSMSCTNSGAQKRSEQAANIMTDTEKLDSSEISNTLTDIEEETQSKSLNDIRFDGWESKDWLDNDYIRALREYLDDYSQGKIGNEDLDPYKQYITGKFIIANIEPYMLGGTFIQIIFLDLPSRIFESWIYSDVNEEKEEVTGYEVRGVHIDKEIYDFKREEILETMKEHPELKAW